MKISEVGDFSAMNSLKVIRMSGEENWMEKFGGMQERTLGDVMSLGPPSGLTGLAQRNSARDDKNTMPEKRKNRIRTINGIGCKTFQSYQSFS